MHIINIVSGRISLESVNIDHVVIIGTEKIKKYEATWPDGFSDTLPQKVVTMSVTKKDVKIECTELIYSRVMVLVNAREINLKENFQYAFAPMPTSMFDENRNMRPSGTKCVLKAKLQVEQPSRTVLPSTTTIIDGCTILWTIHWSTNGTVQDFVNGFTGYVFRKLCDSEVYCIFDRYYDDSIKSGTRYSRAGTQASRQHTLTLATQLPPQKVILTLTENKKQLIEMICH
jgi:hypothetical protein